MELGDYSIMLPESQYNCSFRNSIVTVKRDDAVIQKAGEIKISAKIKKTDIILIPHVEACQTALDGHAVRQFLLLLLSSVLDF